ncbi:MAG TPA: class I SAM-dependent methyltransferase [Leptospiraceae bacterium]|nr:class I SAM-dependent methyltransferase [Leptospiraceae bacterium]HMW04095.1 class I SAM-dependent methyltransferase [Leptospiraceae bacterium]HMX30838.1 class I SAM-dependent methyltransferase [Leptospiraceae bacterium]HMY30088.1 class I SAM-dependent methyltransferase [Leptospiraceae bacterium]HMZ62725.1 class I SAM-dependent methyltransferase [Leptospiraceae bacterium]
MVVAQPYSKFSEIYDHVMGHIDFKRWALFILKSGFPNSSPERALDLGCGTGSLFQYFPDSTYKVGLDISNEMIEVAKRNYPHIEFTVGDIRKFQFSNSFDLITCNHDTLNYLTTTNELSTHFKTIYQNLSDNGLYFFDVSSEKNLIQNFHDRIFRETIGDTFFIWENMYDQKNKEITSSLYFGTNDQDGFKEFREVHKQRFYSNEEIISELEKNGFKVLKIGSDYKRWSYDKNCSLVNFKVRKK